MKKIKWLFWAGARGVVCAETDLQVESIMKCINTSAAPAAIGPYSQGFVVGNLVWTSGQIPLSAETGDIVGANAAEQAEQCIKNLRAVLEAAGSSLSKVIKTTCFLADMGDFAAFNEVYAKHFTGKPARSCVAVKGLPRDVRCEIEAVAEL
jgi:2-iminobutanoate/2-iminopropanoate deaminase